MRYNFADLIFAKKKTHFKSLVESRSTFLCTDYVSSVTVNCYMMRNHNIIYLITNYNKTLIGSGALSGKMLLERIVENNKIDDYLGYFKLRLALPRRVRKGPCWG